MAAPPKTSGQLLASLGWPLLWGVASGGAAFLVAFLTPLFLGGPGSHQGPLAAFVVGPSAFLVGTFVALVVQLRRLSTLTTGGRAAHVVLVLLLLVPSWYAAPVLWQFAQWLPEATAGTSRAERMALVPPLSEEERQLRGAVTFDVAVAVSRGRFPVAYERSLISDLQGDRSVRQRGRRRRSGGCKPHREGDRSPLRRRDRGVLHAGAE